eukprot:8491491-Pyramimonas_sp.AAC.1
MPFPSSSSSCRFSTCTSPGRGKQVDVPRRRRRLGQRWTGAFSDGRVAQPLGQSPGPGCRGNPASRRRARPN